MKCTFFVPLWRETAICILSVIYELFSMYNITFHQKGISFERIFTQNRSPYHGVSLSILSDFMRRGVASEGILTFHFEMLFFTSICTLPPLTTTPNKKKG